MLFIQTVKKMAALHNGNTCDTNIHKHLSVSLQSSICMCRLKDMLCTSSRSLQGGFNRHTDVTLIWSPQLLHFILILSR